MPKKFTRCCPAKALSWQLWSISTHEETKKNIWGGESQKRKSQTAQHDRHHKASVTCFCWITHLLHLFLPLHPDCVSVFAFLSRENSICGYSILTVFATLENPNDHCLLCQWTGAQALKHCGFARQKKNVFVRMWFLNLQCIFDCWYSWLPWLTLENELLLIKWNLMIYIQFCFQELKGNIFYRKKINIMYEHPHCMNKNTNGKTTTAVVVAGFLLIIIQIGCVSCLCSELNHITLFFQSLKAAMDN